MFAHRFRLRFNSIHSYFYFLVNTIDMIVTLSMVFAFAPFGFGMILIYGNIVAYFYLLHGTCYHLDNGDVFGSFHQIQNTGSANFAAQNVNVLTNQIDSFLILEFIPNVK